MKPVMMVGIKDSLHDIFEYKKYMMTYFNLEPMMFMSANYQT